jgi:surface antigen
MLTVGNTTAKDGWQGFRLLKAFFLGVSIAALAACATNSPHQKAMTGMTVGAALGAIVGAAVGGHDGAAMGALIGAAAGGLLGAKLDADDQRKHQAALSIAATQPPGGLASWSSPEKGTNGQVARVGDMFVVGGKQCMSVEESIEIQGKPEVVKGTRCQDNAGQWVQQS